MTKLDQQFLNCMKKVDSAKWMTRDRSMCDLIDFQL